MIEMIKKIQKNWGRIKATILLSVLILWVIFLVGLYIYDWFLGSVVVGIWLFLNWMRKPMTITITKKKRK